MEPVAVVRAVRMARAVAALTAAMTAAVTAVGTAVVTAVAEAAGPAAGEGSEGDDRSEEEWRTGQNEPQVFPQSGSVICGWNGNIGRVSLAT